MYVKANFGMCDIKEKELAQERYIQICNNLSLSSDYKIKTRIYSHKKMYLGYIIKTF